MKRYILPCIIFGWWGGIVLEHLIDAPVRIAWIFIAVAVCATIVSTLRLRRVTLGILCLLCIISMASSLLRAHRQAVPIYDDALAEYVDTHTRITGTVTSHPEIRDHDQRFIITTSQYAVATRIFISTPDLQRIDLGDTLTVRGRIRRPEAFTTDTSRIFHYDQFLAKDNIYFTMHYAEIETHIPSSQNTIRKYAWHIKEQLLATLNTLYREPHGSLLGGMLLGERSRLSAVIQEQFRITGVVHIIVLSGFHITIVSLGIFWVLRSFLSQKIALAMSIIGIIFFVLMVGATSTIIRASTMAIVAICARILGQAHSGFRGLLLAGGVMSMHNTRILLWDISFQLSFLATLGLIVFAEPLGKFLKHIPQFFGIRETFIATISAQLMVTPLIIYSMGTFSIIAPLANVLIVPWTIFIMIGGALSLIIGSLFTSIGMLIMIPVDGLLSVQLFLVEKLSNISFASIMIPALPLWALFVMYVPIIALAIYITKKTSQQLRLGN